MSGDSPRRIWLAVSAMFAFNGSLYGAWASRIPALQDRLDISHGTLGLLLLGLAGGAICAFPLAGRAVDRRGAAPVTRWLGVMNGLAMILLPWMGGIWGVAAVLVLFGAAHGAMDVAMNAWGAEAEKRLSRVWMPGFHAMFSLGAGIGALSGFAAASAGIDMTWHFLSAVLSFGVPAFWLANVIWQSETAESSTGSGFALPTGALVLVGLCAFCSSLGEGAVADWSAVYLRDVTQVSEAQAALGYAVFSAAMVLLRFSGGPVIARLGPVLALRLSGASAALGLALAVGVPVYGAALVGFVFMGFGYALVFPLAFSRAASDGRVPPGQAIAGVATLGYGGLLLGPPIIGALAQATSLRGSFLFLLGLALIMGALAPVLRPATGSKS